MKKKSTFSKDGKNYLKHNLREKGITLIALVVTIIIVLILAGVTIAQITGENGLITRTRQAVDKYKEKEQEEQIQLGQLEQFVSDFSIIGGEENTAVNIDSFTAEGTTDEGQGKGKITATAKVSGSVNKVEFKLSGTENWETGTQGAEGTYTYTFEGLDIGKAYYVLLKITDSEGGSKEATSGVVTLKYGTSATEEQVLAGATYLTADGTKHTGTMPDNGELDETLEIGGSKEIAKGFYSGGHIGTQTLVQKLADEFSDTLTDDSKVLSGNKYINKDGTAHKGSMSDFSGGTKSGTISVNGSNGTVSIPENGFYSTDSKITVSGLSTGSSFNYSCSGDKITMTSRRPELS